MDIISSILDGLDNVGNLVPDLGDLLSRAHTWISVFLMIAPTSMLVLGLIYLFLHPKEANHRLGYRTYFGMGSEDAWRHTQRIAGIAYGGVGLILGIVMGIICLSTRDQETMDLVLLAIKCLIAQVVIVLVIYLGLFVYTAIVFDKNGNRRKDRVKTRKEEYIEE